MKDPAIVVSLLLMMGCKVSGSVQCQEDEHCDLETGGACLRNPDTKRRWCSYPAADCPAGFRWSDLDVGDGVSGNCVPALALDRTSPVIVGRSPSPDSQGVSPTTLISVTFSEPIDPESANASSIRLVDQGGNAVESTYVATGVEMVVTPKVPLDPRLDYRITVTPELTDFAGNGIPEDATWGFRTKEAEWSEPVLLEQEQSKRAVYVDAAAAGDVVVVVWAYQPCTGTTCAEANEIWAVIRKGGIWGAAEKLATTGPRIQQPRVAVSSQGHAIAMWSQEGLDSPGKLFAVRHNGVGWSPPEKLNEFRDGRIVIASITASPGGTWDLLWMSVVFPLNVKIWESLVGAEGWSTPIQVNYGDRGEAGKPSITTGEVPFLLHRSGQDSALTLQQRTNGSWSPAREVSPLSVPLMFHKVASSGTEATIVWATDHVYSRRLAAGEWESAVQIDTAQSPLPLALDSSLPSNQSPVYLAGGTVLALWTTENDVWQAARPPKQPWGPSFVIDAAAQPVNGMRLIAGRRRALALWRNTDLVANEYSETAGWRGAAAAESQPAAISEATAVYDASTNSFVTVWLRANAAGLFDVVASNYR